MQDLLISIEISREAKIKNMLPLIGVLIALCGALAFSIFVLDKPLGFLVALGILVGIWFCWRWLARISGMPARQYVRVRKDGDDLVVAASDRPDADDPTSASTSSETSTRSLRLNLSGFRVAWVHQDNYKDAGLTDSAIHFATEPTDEKIQSVNVGAWNLHPDVYKIAFIHHEVLFFVGDNFPNMTVLTAGGERTLTGAWQAWNQPPRHRPPDAARQRDDAGHH